LGYGKRLFKFLEQKPRRLGTYFRLLYSEFPKIIIDRTPVELFHDYLYQQRNTITEKNGEYTLSPTGLILYQEEKERIEDEKAARRSENVTNIHNTYNETHGNESPIVTGGSLNQTSKKENKSFWKHPVMIYVGYPAALAFIIWISTLLYAKLIAKNELPAKQPQTIGTPR
jgi:hypothetical protein